MLSGKRDANVSRRLALNGLITDLILFAGVILWAAISHDYRVAQIVIGVSLVVLAGIRVAQLLRAPRSSRQPPGTDA